jgi:hypothetical protein
MKKLISFLIIFACTQQLKAQGCVTIRSNGATCSMSAAHADASTASKWSIGINARYFRSYKHFVGTIEQHERVEQGTEVINHNVSTEIALLRQLNQRWSLGLFLPVISNVRSSLYEHYGNANKSPLARRQTRSFGLGDARVAAYYWLVNPAMKSKVNVQVGAGIKLASGEYKYLDYFWKNDSTKVLGPVDQSIQLGDGGTGITTELNAFYRISKQLALYGNGYYLFNPREHNGVSTARGALPSATAIAYGSDVMSVPDQFMFRLGANFALDRFQFSGGMRIEGIPARDAIGGSNGFRRPGYVISLEPVVSMKLKEVQLYLSVPVALERNRIQSVPDKIRTQRTGVYAHGDAAFADYSVNMGIAIPFGN